MKIIQRVGILLAVIVMAFLAFFAVRDIKNTLFGIPRPDTVVHDTTVVHDSIPFPVPHIIIKYMKAPVDSSIHADSTKWYTATGRDISERGDTVGVIYNSPVRLSPSGFFSDFIVKHAPIWIPVDTVFITTTITKYEQYFSWWETIAVLAVGFIAGALAL